MDMTRAQIRGQINQLNRELSSVKNTYIQYQNLKNRVTQIINLLNNSLKKLNDSKAYLKKGYGNNTKTTPFKNTTNDIQKVTEIKKYLELRVNLEINKQSKALNKRTVELQKRINKLWKEYYRATD